MNLKNIIYNQLEIKISNKFAVKIANKIVNDNLILRVGHVPSDIEDDPSHLKFDEYFNWNIEIGEKTNMAMFHLYSFEPIKYLLQAFEENSNELYLEKSIELLQSWIKNADNNKSFYNWYDHCVAERCLVIILLKLNLNTKEINEYDDLIIKFLVTHQSFLANPENYNFGNHGLMMDRSLYIITKYLQNDEGNQYINLSKKRISELFNDSFSENGINVENSIAYHLFNMDLYILIETELLNYFNDSIGDDFEEKIRKALYYIAVFTQPNNKFPNIGDGERYNIDQLFSRKTGEYFKTNKYLNGGKTLGSTNFYYQEEGIYYHKNSKAFVSFISGKKYNNHKHADDLSFTFSHENDDVFVDCGTYTYQKGEFRNHFMSSKSHNGLLIENEGYSFLSTEINKVGLIHFEENDEFSYIVGKNDLFETANINRHLIITRKGSVIIYDEILSPFYQKVIQNFNLHPDFNDANPIVNNNNVMIEHPKSKKMLIMQQHLNTKSNISFGNSSIPDYGVYSEKFHKIDPIFNLRFENNCNEFLTSIRYSDINSHVFNVLKHEHNIIINEENNELKVHLYNEKRSMNQLGVVKSEYVSDNDYIFTALNNYDFEKPEFAWYIYKNGKLHEKIWYSKDNFLEYHFNEPGNYKIQSYTIDKSTKKKKVIWFKEIIRVK